MNSLYKSYIKKSLILILISIFFSFLGYYITKDFLTDMLSNLLNVSQRAEENFYSIYDLEGHYFNYMSYITLIDLLFMALYLLSIYSYRNKNVVNFVLHLPIKRSQDNLTKILVAVVSLTLIFAFQILMYFALTKNIYQQIYELLSKVSHDNLTLDMLYSKLFNKSLLFYGAFLLIFSGLFLSINLIGKNILALITPFILVLGVPYTSSGIYLFLKILNLNFLVNLGRNITLSIFDNFPNFQFTIIHLVILSIIVFAISFVCALKLDNANINNTFLFKPIKYILNFCVTIIISFSVYYILLSNIQIENMLFNVFVLAFIAITSIKLLNNLIN